jgi:hypothetical protein
MEFSGQRGIQILRWLRIAVGELCLLLQARAEMQRPQAERLGALHIQFGAGEMNRTPDLLITNELLYRLSYTGVARDYSAEPFGSFRTPAGAEVAQVDFLHAKKAGGLVLILSSRSRGSAD